MSKHQSHNVFSKSGLMGLLLVVFSVPIYSQTVTLQLNNGDRISGLIISEDSNRVIVSNAWAKEIIIPHSEIKLREKVVAAPTPAATNAPVVAKPEPIPPATPIPPPKPVAKVRKAKDWHGDIQVGADAGFSEKDRQLLYGKFKITYAPVEEGTPSGTSKFLGRFRNIFDYYGAYGETDGNLSANRMDGSSKTDFDLGENRKVFVYNLMGAGYDEIRRIEYRYEVGPGVGYHVLVRTNLALNAEVGLNYQVQEFWRKGPRTLAHDRTYDQSENFYYRLAEDFNWRISKKLTFDEKFEFFPKMDSGEFRFRFESNLRYWLWEYLSFNLTVLDIYDTESAPSVGKNDLQIRSSIGVKF